MHRTLATSLASVVACMGRDGVTARLPGSALPGVRRRRTEQRKGGGAQYARVGWRSRAHVMRWGAARAQSRGARRRRCAWGGAAPCAWTRASTRATSSACASPARTSAACCTTRRPARRAACRCPHTRSQRVHPRLHPRGSQRGLVEVRPPGPCARIIRRLQGMPRRACPRAHQGAGAASDTILLLFCFLFFSNKDLTEARVKAV
jgi:hypothetical protein